jgi:hypothetical protein
MALAHFSRHVTGVAGFTRHGPKFQKNPKHKSGYSYIHRQAILLSQKFSSKRNVVKKKVMHKQKILSCEKTSENPACSSKSKTILFEKNQLHPFLFD